MTHDMMLSSFREMTSSHSYLSAKAKSARPEEQAKVPAGSYFYVQFVSMQF
jgi:hypothetical protein